MYAFVWITSLEYTDTSKQTIERESWLSDRQRSRSNDHRSGCHELEPEFHLHRSRN